MRIGLCIKNSKIFPFLNHFLVFSKIKLIFSMAKLFYLAIQLIEKAAKSPPSSIVIKQLLLVGANPNASDVFGRTLLYKLAFSTKDNTTILNFLLDLGTHVNAIHLDNEHHPAYMVSCLVLYFLLILNILNC